jgi:hypothetical protein
MTAQTRYHIAPQIIGLILLSLIPFMWLALGALQAGALLPTYFLICAVLFMAIVYLVSVRWLAIAAVKLWGVFLLLYAIIRIAIGTAAKFGAIKSAHVIDATSVFYFLVSFLLLAIGLKLCVMREQK